MGIFDFFKSKNQKVENIEIQKFKFGRFSDSYKKQSQYDAWELSLSAFEEKSYLDSYRNFLKYLNDSDINNVIINENNGTLDFQILQGSKSIIGTANAVKVKAISKIAKSNELNIGFLRRLVELNYTMDYNRYALDEDNNICLMFDSTTLDGSPYKLYYALKENALHSDKLDDVLLSEFDSLSIIDQGSRIELTAEEINTKIQYLTNKLKSVLNIVQTSPIAESYPGGNAYLLMSVNYFLDYLLGMEGSVMDTFEKINNDYFANNGKSLIQKNNQIIKDFTGILELSRKDLEKEMYGTVSTFGVTTPRMHDYFSNFVDSEISAMDWYLENGHLDIAQSIPHYIVGYTLFNNALPKPDMEMLDLYIQIFEQQFYYDLGYKFEFFDHEKQVFNVENIKSSIQTIIASNSNKFPRFDPNLSTLDYTNTINFAKSYLIMLRNADLSIQENA
jgi:hypothetical protein